MSFSDYKGRRHPSSRSRSRRRGDSGPRQRGYRRRSYSRHYDRKPQNDRYRRKDSPDRHRRHSRHRSTSPKNDENGEPLLFLNPNLSESHARSRAAERKRRKLQAECIRRAGGFQKLADQEGHETVRLFWDGFQWVAKTDYNSGPGVDPALMNSTRKLRRLYFGNLPINMGLTESGFQNILWNEMRNRNFCNDPNTCPVLYVWFAKDKANYGFVEFATVEETERALTMDGMNCMGSQVRISRPNDYSTAAIKGATQPQQPPMAPVQVEPIVLIKDRFKGTCMRVIEIVLPSTIESEIEYLDVLDDVKEGFAQHGKIKNIAIIAPRHKDMAPQFNVGDILVEFVDNESLVACVQNMTNRKYENRIINMEPLDSEIFSDVAMEIIADLELMDDDK